MDKAFWNDRWQRRETGFHQQHIHAQLLRFWPKLGLPQESAVFVPLAARAATWSGLPTQGHRGDRGRAVERCGARVFRRRRAGAKRYLERARFEIFVRRSVQDILAAIFSSSTADVLKDVVPSTIVPR